MNSFFKSTLKSRLYKNKNRYPILKIMDLIDWKELGLILKKFKKQTRKDRRGKAGYDSLKMFKAILIGQWHSLSDPELEKSLILRADFVIFCDFDDMETPDHSTLCRFRNYLIGNDLLDILLMEINSQLENKNLKIAKAKVAIVDASIIESAGRPQRKYIAEKDGKLIESTPSKDVDATWTRKNNKFYLGYKLHAICDEEGYFQKLKISPANEHESNYFEPLLTDLYKNTEVLADKGYFSNKNSKTLANKGLIDGIMEKKLRNSKLTQEQKNKNNKIKLKRYVIEQSFGTLKRIFGFSRAAYFGLKKVLAQSLLKCMCLNLLKASNKVTF